MHTLSSTQLPSLSDTWVVYQDAQHEIQSRASAAKNNHQWMVARILNYYSTLWSIHTIWLLDAVNQDTLRRFLQRFSGNFSMKEAISKELHVVEEYLKAFSEWSEETWGWLPEYWYKRGTFADFIYGWKYEDLDRTIQWALKHTLFRYIDVVEKRLKAYKDAGYVIREYADNGSVNTSWFQDNKKADWSEIWDKDNAPITIRITLEELAFLKRIFPSHIQNK